MRLGAKDLRRIVRCLPAATVGLFAVGAELSTNALANIIELKPFLGVEQVFTDNVRASNEDRDADGVTILSARLQAALRTSRITAVADVNAFYDEFWATNSLDNLNGNGIIAGRAEVLERIFFIDAVAEKQDVYLSPTDISASDLTTGQGTIQQESYRVSPLLTTEVFGLADLVVRGTYGQIQFDKPVVGIAATLLTDITVKHVGGRISTGERSSLYELIGTAEYLETDLGFEQRNVVGSAYLHLTPGFSALGRIGYERTFDPSFPMIRGTLWSLGGRYRFGESEIQFEFGRRFDDDVYLGEMNIALTSRIRVRGSYTDTLTPIQLTLVRAIGDLFDEEGNLDVSVNNTPSFPDPLILDAIVRDKEMLLTATYIFDLRTYTLAIGHNDRHYPSLLDNEKFLAVGLQLEEQLSRRLVYLLNLQYQDNYKVLAPRPTSQIYSTQLSFLYQYNESVVFTGGYTWRLEETLDDSDTYENVLRFGVTQAF